MRIQCDCSKIQGRPLENDDEHFNDCPAKGPFGLDRPKPVPYLIVFDDIFIDED